MEERESKQKQVVVSVMCNTYNHEAYVRDALEGFVMQKTTFPFEVLIHDDASTDHTADIIREYAERYPDLIKPLYQKENQYSKGVPIWTIQFPRVTGKYVAFCEGDDYWTDPLKLQKQYEAMERHPELDICSHVADRIDARTGEKVCEIAPTDQDRIVSAEECIRRGSFVATNSYFYRSVLVRDIPEFRRLLGIDYTLQAHGALRGGMLHLKDNMSVYRTNVKNSWTDRMRNAVDKKIAYKKKSIRVLKQMDIDTGRRFHKILRKKVFRQRLKILALSLGIGRG